MKRSLSLVVLGFAALACFMAPPVWGSILHTGLALYQLNTLEDESRESIVDINGNNILDAGDVLFGWIRLNDRSIPTPGVSFGSDNVYAVFSQQLLSISPVPPPSGYPALYQLTFQPTTIVGLRLQDLVSVPASALAKGTPTVAVYEDVGADLINFSPGDFNGDLVLNMFDFTSRIGTGTLDAVAGFDDVPPTQPDFASAFAFAITAATDIQANLALLRTAPFTLNTSIGVGYNQGLTALYDTIGLLRNVPDPTLQTPFLFDITVSSGSAYGAVNATYGGVNPFSFSFTLNGQTVEAYPLANKANVNVFPIPIPEPFTFVIWGVLLCIAVGWRTWHRFAG